jgi:hypothetical protein
VEKIVKPTNPFEVLRLDPESTEEAIVRQAGRLRQRATGEAELNAIREAVQALTADPATRRLHALLTHPRPGHQAAALDAFAAAFRRPPAATEATCPPLDFKELEQILLTCAAEELGLPAAPWEAPAAMENPDEIHRQNAEALWQSLLCDPRA